MATPTISSISGTISNGQTISITGANMLQEVKTNWNTSFDGSFEGTDPGADGFSQIGQTDGVYSTAVKLMGAQSMLFNVSGSTPEGNEDMLESDNAVVSYPAGAKGEIWLRTYVRYHSYDGTWPSDHIKMIMTQGDGVDQYYFEPYNGPTMPSYFNAAFDSADHDVAIPSGQLQNDRWYCIELHLKSTSPQAFEVWIDGVHTVFVPTGDGTVELLLFGVINASGTGSSFNLDNFFDGLVSSSSRVYPASTIEVSNNATYGSGTVNWCAPVFISDTSSQATLNLSGLGAGPYYLFITNNGQQQSAGFSLSGGGGGTGSINVTDNGYGADRVSATSPKSVGDTGGGTDSITVIKTAGAFLTEHGYWTETVTVSKQLAPNPPQSPYVKLITHEYQVTNGNN